MNASSGFQRAMPLAAIALPPLLSILEQCVSDIFHSC